MLDKTESVTTENTTSALSHLAFCAQAALGLGLARQDGIAGTLNRPGFPGEYFS
ncbi:hypothetical protein [Serratia odorifera]|uniref:hypothetical protein n=1 Tax=Serratia odorifera TaxID=618 RepID=UPI0018E777C3|nr:hypothetical protein [Serratia odorifera]MBJ2068113.1 hypothetical protein [Serratia odorifera]